MYLTSSLHQFYDCVKFDSFVAAIRFARVKAAYAQTPIDVYYIGPKRRLRIVWVGDHPGCKRNYDGHPATPGYRPRNVYRAAR